MNEQEKSINNADEALKEMLAIAERYGLSYAIVLTDEHTASGKFDVDESCPDKKLVMQNLCKAAKMILGGLLNEAEKKTPKVKSPGNGFHKQR